MKKLTYSPIALSKRKKIKREIREKYGKEKADSVSNHTSKVLADLKKFPDMGTSMRETYDLDCDYLTECTGIAVIFTLVFPAGQLYN